MNILLEVKRNLLYLFTIFILAVFCSSCLAQTEAQKNGECDSGATQPPNSSNKSGLEISDWKIYKDAKNGFLFRYPPSLILEKKKDAIRLYHFVEYRFQDPCDFRDDPPFLEKLVDFDVTLKIVNKNLDRAVAGYPQIDYPQDAAWKLAGIIEGKSLRQTDHFCGSYVYFYPFSKNRSLIFEQKIAGYLYEPAYSEAKKTDAWKNPNVIKPENAAEIFGKIIESFEFEKKESKK